MQIVKEQFQVKITGKWLTKADIMKLFDFGFSKEGIVKKYKKDNKIKEVDARKIVEETLLENT